MSRQQRRKAEREAAKGGQTAEWVLARYALGAPAEELREVLQTLWVADSGPIIRAASVRGVSVPALFRAAQFPIPDYLPDEFTVWRAAWGDPDEVAKGLSWTPDQWAAHALAGELLAQGHSDTRRPVVVRRTIRRDQVVFVYAHRAEEIVFDAPPVPGEVDGTEADWEAARLDAIASLQ